MYGREQRVLLRHYLEQGIKKAELARRLGVSRRTLYYWVESGQLDRELDGQSVQYRPRPPVICKIDPYRAILENRLATFPKLSAVRLHEEIKAAGYQGSYTQVKACVRQIRPTLPPDPVVRFETPPGHQAQVDFAEFRLPWGKRYALVVVLGYSRLLWVRFYERQTMAVLMRGLEEAFGFFRGVAAELLFDQMKAVIIEDQREVGGRVLENAEFMRFAAHWNFRIRACRAYRAKTKGKVERPIRYVRENFFYGRTFLNDADLNTQTQHWMERTANPRLHRTTMEIPYVRFERDERALLRPLAAHPYRQVMPSTAPVRPKPAGLPQVERRSLAIYDQLAQVQA